MKMSETIGELATALSKAQGQIEAATKASVNPAFKSKYADINALRDAIREPLAVNDLSILQFPRTTEGRVEVETMILHKSGEYMSEVLSMPVGKPDAHGIGSALTYARRYGMSAILNLAADDDDGNAAVVKPTISAADFEEAMGAASQGRQAFLTWWENNEEIRKGISEKQMAALKAAVANADKPAKVAKEAQIGHV
jgi:hypothetical protein